LDNVEEMFPGPEVRRETINYNAFILTWCINKRLPTINQFLTHSAGFLNKKMNEKTL